MTRPLSSDKRCADCFDRRPHAKCTACPEWPLGPTDPGQKLFDAVRKNVRSGDLALSEWDDRTYQDGEWTSKVFGLKEPEKVKWRRAAAALGLK